MLHQKWKALLLSCLSGLIIVFPAFAEDIWTTYTHSNYINGIVIRGDSAWCATSGGVVCWNTSDSTYTKYTVRDGLGGNTVYCIAAAPNGDIWCGSAGGVSRFDGRRWETHSFASSQWRNIPVWAIAIGPDGTVWCGADGMIHLFREGEWEAVYPARDIVSALAVDANGDLWAGVSDDDCPVGVWRFRSGTPGTERYLSQYIHNLHAGPDGRLWCATGDTLRYFDGNRWAVFASEAPVHHAFTSVAATPDGAVWGGTSSDGLVRFEEDRYERFSTANGLPGDRVLSLATGADGVLWCGTARTYGRGMGLSRFDGNSWRTYTISDCPASFALTSLALGMEGEIWCGTRESGVVRFDGERWRNYTTADGLSDSCISSVAIATDGGVWCGVYAIPGRGGAARFDGERWKMYTSEGGIIGSFVDLVFTEPDGGVVCRSVDPSGGYSLSHFDGTAWTRDERFTGIPGGEPRIVAPGPGDTLWCVYPEGLAQFGGQKWMAHAVPDSIGQIFCLAAAPDGSIWGGCYRGVWRFDGNAWKTWSTADGLAGNWVDQIAIGKNGEVWCTTEMNMIPDGLYGAGIARFDGKTWRQYTTVDGLADNSVYSITIGPDDRVYFLTSGGISVLAPDTGVAVRENANLPEQFALLSSHPNPFNPSTTISFTLPVPGKATLTIYDATGRKVRTLVSGTLPAGVHSAVWDGRDERGKTVSSGVYLSRLESGKAAHTVKMLLIK